MSIPLDRLYHYIESVAQDVYGDVLIYRFYPHGSKKIEDLNTLRGLSGWVKYQTIPVMYCHDQEPLDFDYYQGLQNTSPCVFARPMILEYLQSIGWQPNNIQKSITTIYDHCILLHSEQNSTNVEKYRMKNFIPVYYWCHGIIALDWFRFAKHSTLNKIPDPKTFLIYNRAWSGTREYRLKFADLLVKNQLIDHCNTFFNPNDSDVHYTQHKFINANWVPTERLENYFSPSTVTSCASADFNVQDYNASEFEVVLETLFDDPRIQLTEKILRPIACGQPFLLASTPNSLEYLRNYGFKTFNGIIDEHYDTIIDPMDRMHAIIDSMRKIIHWDQNTKNTNAKKIKEIVDYNKNHFFSNQFFEHLTNELKENLSRALQQVEINNTGQCYFNFRKILAQDPACRNYMVNNSAERSRSDVVKVVKAAKTYYNKY